MDFQPIETAPLGCWVAVCANHGAIFAAIRDGEPGWWEDEAGDYTIEAKANNGQGITKWLPLPLGYVVSAEGTSRAAEPVFVPPP